MLDELKAGLNSVPVVGPIAVGLIDSLPAAPELPSLPEGGLPEAPDLSAITGLLDPSALPSLPGLPDAGSLPESPISFEDGTLSIDLATPPNPIGSLGLLVEVSGLALVELPMAPVAPEASFHLFLPFVSNRIADLLS